MGGRMLQAEQIRANAKRHLTNYPEYLEKAAAHVPKGHRPPKEVLWVALADALENDLPEEKAMVLKVVFLAGHCRRQKGKERFAQLQEDLHIERRTLYRWIDEILLEAMVRGLRKGLL
jgi:hypothetical protein